MPSGTIRPIDYFVKGSPDVKYERIIHAMDISRGAGVKVIGVPPKEDAAASGG